MRPASVENHSTRPDCASLVPNLERANEKILGEINLYCEFGNTSQVGGTNPEMFRCLTVAVIVSGFGVRKLFASVK